MSTRFIQFPSGCIVQEASIMGVTIEGYGAPSRYRVVVWTTTESGKFYAFDSDDERDAKRVRGLIADTLKVARVPDSR